MSVLPEAIRHFWCLESLNISANSMRSLPDGLGDLTKLEILDASCNAIEALPKSVKKAKKSLKTAAKALTKAEDDKPASPAAKTAVAMATGPEGRNAAVKHLEEAKENVAKRVEFIETEISKLDAAIATKQGDQTTLGEEIGKLQTEMQKSAAEAAQAVASAAQEE